MIKITITDPEDPAVDSTLEGEAVLYTVLISTDGGGHKVNGGLIGQSSHKGLVHLLVSAAKAVSETLSACKACRNKAAVMCVETLIIRNDTDEEKTEETATAVADC